MAATAGQYPGQPQRPVTGGRPLPRPPQQTQPVAHPSAYTSNAATEAAWYEHEARLQPSYIFQQQQQLPPSQPQYSQQPFAPQPQLLQQQQQLQQQQIQQGPRPAGARGPRPLPQGAAQPYYYAPPYANQPQGPYPPTSYQYQQQQQQQQLRQQGDPFVTRLNPYSASPASRIVSDNSTTNNLRVGTAKGSAFMHKGFWDIISLVNNQSGSPSRLLAPPSPNNRGFGFGGRTSPVPGASNPSSPSKFKATFGRATAGLRRVPVPAAPSSPPQPALAQGTPGVPVMSESTYNSADSGAASPISSNPSDPNLAPTRVVSGSSTAALATNLFTGPRATKKRISIDMISAPQHETFVHAAHASDAEQAEVILKRWSRDGMGKIADPRWVEPLKEAMRMQAAHSQAQAIAEVQAALHQESVIKDQPRQLQIVNGAPSTTPSTMTTSTSVGTGHIQPLSQYYSAVGGTVSPILMASSKPFDNIQEEGGQGDAQTEPGANENERLIPPRPFQGIGLPRSNTQDTMLIYSPGEGDVSKAGGNATAAGAADYMQYRPSPATLANANIVMPSRPTSKYDGLPGAAGLPLQSGLPDGRPMTMLVHDMPPPPLPSATGLPLSQDTLLASNAGDGEAKAAGEQTAAAPVPFSTGTITASAAAGGLALALQAAAIRPSLQTIEKSVAAKIYFENLYYSILKKPRARDTRRAGLEAELAAMGNRISELEKEAIRAKWLANETEYLREMRARVNVNSFVRLKTIGHGAFGVVALVKERGTGGLFAMKQLRKADMLRKGQEGHVRAERDLMTSASASASAKWIVKLVYSFQDVDHLYLIMEFMGGGDLLNLLIEKDIFEEDFARFYVAEMILGIHEAHRFGYIHRDIKPDNFLFTADGHIKLADFGLCQSFHWAHDGAYYDQQRKNLLKKHGIDLDDSYAATAGRRRGAAAAQAAQHQGAKGNGLNEKELGDVMSDRNEDGTPMTHVLTWRDKNKKKIAYSVVGTNNYMAPEVLRGLGYDQSCDWWSLGVIVFEMLYGYPPFVSKSRHLTRQKILNWRQTLKFPPRPKVSRDAQDFIAKLICEREDRLGTAGSASVSRPNSIIQRERRSGILTTGANGAGGSNPGLLDGVEELMAHPWFRNVDWAGLHRQRAPFRPALAHPADTKHFEDDIAAEPLPAPGAGEPGANPNADQPRDPMLRDKQHGKNLLEMRKQLAFVGYTFKAPRDVNFLEDNVLKGKQGPPATQRGRSREPTEAGSRLRSMSM